MEQYRSKLKDKKRIVVKIGSSSLQHPQTGELDYIKLEILVRELCNLKNQGKDVVLVTSGAIAQGRRAMHLSDEDFSQNRIAMKQACAAIGQCELMFIYDKFFGEYHQNVAQVLLTADVTARENSRMNVVNTFSELLSMGIIPIVNENDTVAVDELEGRNFGDNDTLSAIVASLVGADALVILTDIDGLYDKNPKTCPDAKRIPLVRAITDEVRAMAGGAGSSRGTGGMATKIRAAQVAAESHIPTVILAGDDPENLYRVFEGEDIGTVFDCG